MAKRLFRLACPLLTGLTPGICMAIGDGVDGAAFLFAFLKFELGWTALTFVVFLLLLLRKISGMRRIAYCLVFWMGQIVVPFVLSAADTLYGTPGAKDNEQATKPVVLAGVTFPAGSNVEYDHLGGGFWRRKLVDADTVQPVKFGPWSITHLNLIEGNENIAYVHLTRPETIEGWPCDDMPAFDLRSTPPRLDRCELAAPKQMGELSWGAGTFLQRTETGGWSLAWFGGSRSGGQNKPMLAFGFPVISMTGTYTATYELQAWQGDTTGRDVTIGDYTFLAHDFHHMAWQPPDEIRIGYGRNDKTGKEVRCVFVRMQDRRMRPCDDANE